MCYRRSGDNQHLRKTGGQQITECHFNTLFQPRSYWISLQSDTEPPKSRKSCVA
jgi:hypothetical protein